MQIETHNHELNGLHVGGIKDNRKSHKWSKYTRMRRDEEKRSWGARRAEEAESDSHREIGEVEEVVRDMMQGDWIFQTVIALLPEGGQLLLSQRLSVLTPLSARGKTGGGLKCERGRGSETGRKWKEQRAKWKRDEEETVPVPAHRGFCACAPACLWALLSPETVCRLLLTRTCTIESLRGFPSGIDTYLQGLRGKSH